MHKDKSSEYLLKKAGIKSTANRLTVLDKLQESDMPLGLMELETELSPMDRSSISRVLSLLLKHDVIHAFEDGRGVAKYEICHGESHCSPEDMHAHFFCEKCNRVFCFENVEAPKIDVPEGFRVHGINYMLKGLCPSCGGS